MNILTYLFINISSPAQSLKLCQSDDQDNHIVEVSAYPGVEFIVLSCLVAFVLSEKDRKCVCESKLPKLVQNCYIDSLSIERMQNNFWVSKESNSPFIILHEFRCPLNYCKVNPVNVTLGKSNVQCDFNRTGTLCGHCHNHYSLALGSFHCISCSNNYILLILPFTLVGVLLVAIVFLFRLTVAVGTLNGLLFYANIIQANHQAFFPRNTVNILPYLCRG